MTIETGYIVAGIAFIVIGLCLVAAYLISKKPCCTCAHWMLDKDLALYPERGMCRLKWQKKQELVNKLMHAGLTSNAGRIIDEMDETTYKLDGCHKHCARGVL
jgi:hypothetical protein